MRRQRRHPQRAHESSFHDFHNQIKTEWKRSLTQEANKQQVLQTLNPWFAIFPPSQTKSSVNCSSGETYGEPKISRRCVTLLQREWDKGIDGGSSTARRSRLTASLRGSLSALRLLSLPQGSHRSVLHTHTHTWANKHTHTHTYTRTNTHLNGGWWVIIPGQQYWWSPRKLY